jgi:hypothetical protein
VSLPALEWLRADYTEVWTSGDNLPLVRFADRARSIASTGLDLVELGMAETAILRGFDSIVSWYGANRPAFRDAVVGLPIEFHPALPIDASAHAVNFFCSQVGAPVGATPRIDVPRWEGGYVAIHPFSGSSRKNWPLDRFRAVAELLEPPIEWSAGPNEELEGARRFDDRLALAQWLAGARCYLGNDSGVSHLAAAVGTPVVAVFVASDPRVWAPRGTQVRVLLNPGVEEVAEAVADRVFFKVP